MSIKSIDPQKSKINQLIKFGMPKFHPLAIYVTALFFSIASLIVVYLYRHELNLSKNKLSFLIGSVKDIFQIIFFIVVGCVTILTYKQARKTLFTPIRTEIFKMQIKSFEEILAFFQSKTETDFSHQFDFNFIVSGNARLMFNDFVSTFYEKEIKINEDTLKELYSQFSGAVVTGKYMEENFHSPEYYEKIKPQERIEINNPALLLDKWRRYDFGQIHFSKKYYDEMQKLNTLIASPLLPVPLKNKLVEFESKVGENLWLVGKILTKIAQELPERFPNAKSLENLDLSGIWNKYNHESKPLEPSAKEILVYIRQYLKIETLVD
ncbi:hypothetical protein [Dyadobacter pollutisoli]|uniref:DUF4760 domain-containing protein n=1 Tax=Dyadobacter pollutisoli TaxID=2910158 RepID=A0A9E8NCM5_9BACT|nr:hypothetical protein [Dyadobacter pollutisoli]WAC12531.1 hypothetical protein ON006_00925 [Dyadobacter pollutisoli]